MNNYKTALEDVLLDEFSWIDYIDPNELNHKFSKEFEVKMNKIFKMPECTYVSFGYRRIRKSLAVALIAALVLAFSGCAAVVHHIIVTWNETQNFDAGTVDINFDVKNTNPNQHFSYITPITPAGFSITSEDKQNSTYAIEYAKNDNELIIYSQDAYVENMSLSIDNEESSLVETNVNGYKGYSYSRGDMNAIIWTDGISLFTLQSTCEMSILVDLSKTIK